MATSPQATPPNKGKGRASDQLAPSAQEDVNAPLSGNIGSASTGGPNSTRRVIGGVQVETR